MYNEQIKEMIEDEENPYEGYGEGFLKPEEENKMNDEWYDKAFEEEKNTKTRTKKKKPEEDYEYDQVGLNKRDPMNQLNKTKLEHKELYELLNKE